MGLRALELLDFLRDNLGKVLIAVGILFFLLGVFMLADSYFILTEIAFVPAISLFLGILLAVYGLFVQVGLLSGRLRSIDGLGTIILCVSVGFFALAFSAIQVQLVTGFEKQGMPSRSGGGESPFALFFPISVRPFLFLFGLGLQWGIILLATSLILKAFSYFRH
jgi:hypothetical protein